MAVKYNIRYFDIVGNEFDCEFDNDTYSGSVIELEGRCSLRTVPVQEHYSAIRGRALDITVLAKTEEPLSDLWQDDEYYWRVTFKKNSQVRFIGYLSTEDFREPYNSDRWEINIEAVGPLAVLDGSAYVDSLGAPFTGFRTVMETIASALQRGFTQSSHHMEIYARVDISGAGQPATTSDTFYNFAHIDQSLYLKDDGETIQDSQEVLREILESIGCVIFQEYGRFYILPLVSISGISGLAFKDYGTNGIYIQNVSESNLETTVGDESTQNIFHVNENQEILNRRSVDTFKIRHDFEYGDQLIPNGEMIGTGSMPSWTVEAAYAVVGTNQIFIVGVEEVLGASFTVTNSAVTSTAISVKEGESFTLTFDMFFIDIPAYQYFKVLLGNGVDFYELSENGWTDGSVNSRMNFDSEGPVVFNLEVPPLPIDGDLSINFRQGVFHPDNHTASSRTILNSVTMTSKDGIIAGREFEYKKTSPKKEKVKDTETIRFSTSDNDSLKNTFYTSGGASQIATVNFGHNGTNFTGVSSGYYVAFIRAIMQQKKQREFFGDIRGDVKLLGSIEYDGVSDRMIPIEHSYDTYNNITTVRALELDDEQDLDGAITERTSYTETIKPTIV